MKILYLLFVPILLFTVSKCKESKQKKELTLQWYYAIDSLPKETKLIPSEYEKIKLKFLQANSDTEAINLINQFIDRNYNWVLQDTAIEMLAHWNYENSKKKDYDYGEADALRLLGKFEIMKGRLPDTLLNLSINKAKKRGYKDLQIKALCALGTAFTQKNCINQLKYLNSALEVAKKSQQKTLILMTYKSLGYTYSYRCNDQSKALDMHLKTLELANELHDTSEVINTIEKISRLYEGQKNYEKAIFYTKKKLDYKKNSHYNKSETLNSLSGYFSHLKEYDSTLFYLKEVEKIAGDSIEGMTLCDIGNVYSLFQNYDLAIEYYKRGITKQKKKFGNISIRYGIVITYQPDIVNLAEIYCKINECSKAFKCLSELKQDIAFPYLKYDYYKALTKAYMCEHNYKAAITASDSMISSKESSKTTYNETDIEMHELLIGLYDSMNMPTKAYKIYRNFIKINDSVHKNSEIIKVAEVEAKANEQTLKAEQDKRNILATVELRKQKMFRNIYLAATFLFILATIGVFVAYRQKQKDNFRIGQEKQKSETLLLNILPYEVAEELKERGTAKAKQFDNVTILFTDFKSFTTITETLTPQQLVDELHFCFSAFDQIINKYNIEKIKTIGDAYLAVSGLPATNPKHAEEVVKAAIEIRNFMKQRSLEKETFQIRIGIHSGSVVAGIVGLKKFAYDIWGDAVNTAARLEENSEPDKINLSEATYNLTCNINSFKFQFRGEIEAKNKGKLKMYFVETS